MNATDRPTRISAPPGQPFIDIDREFDATPAQVFRAVSDPELVIRWLGPRDLEMTIERWDFSSGGGYRYLHHAARGEFGFRGVFHTVVADELIIQTFEFDGAPGQVSLERMALEATADGTRTIMHMHSMHPSVETRDLHIANGMERGVHDSMDRLAELLA